ncbi:hypothetical protein [Porticoccus sp.]
MRLAAALCCALLSLSPAAEEPAGKAPQPPATRTAPDSGATTNQKGTATSSPTSGKSSAPEFDPSEEISEDLSVPFPVDI